MTDWIECPECEGEGCPICNWRGVVEIDIESERLFEKTHGG